MLNNNWFIFFKTTQKDIFKVSVNIPNFRPMGGALLVLRSQEGIDLCHPLLDGRKLVGCEHQQLLLLLDGSQQEITIQNTDKVQLSLTIAYIYDQR